MPKPQTLVRPGLGGVPTIMQVTYLPEVARKPTRQPIKPGTGRVRGRKTRASERLGFGSLKGLSARSEDLTNCRICAARKGR
jgi:hypothetical protein